MKILIIKFAALGDVLRTTSILQALDSNYPDSEIHWVTNKNAVPLLINNPYISKVFSYSEETASYLKSQSFDLVINLDEDYDSCSLASSLKTKKLIGNYLKNNEIVPTASAREWFNMSALGPQPKNDILKKQNKKTYQEIMLEIIGIKSDNYDTLLFLTPEQEKFAKDFARRYNLKEEDLIIGINTGARDKWPKNLDAKKTASLIKQLYTDHKAKIILFGGPNEIDYNNEVISLAGVPIIHTGCGNDLFEFPATTSLCKLFITSDSLGMHIALALKRNVIALFGPTSAAEIEMYNLGRKVISSSSCYCCYKSWCTAMDSIQVKDILKESDALLKPLTATILITSYKEPRITKALDSVLNQNINYKYEILVAAPDQETENIVKEYSKEHPNIKFFKDPGKGKMYALNLLLKEIKTDITIATDGDVYVSNNSINDILDTFTNNQLMGVVGGHPIPLESRNYMWGYFSHLLFYGAHRVRLEGSKLGYLECSGYLFAFRNNIVKDFPLDVPEDTIIPLYFWQKGYKIGYAENALVYVKNVDNPRDWLKQKTRTSKAHQQMMSYVNAKRIIKVKTFTNELKKGTIWALSYFQNIKELYWTFVLFFLRLSMWTNVYLDLKFRKRLHTDNWEKVSSAR